MAKTSYSSAAQQAATAGIQGQINAQDQVLYNQDGYLFASGINERQFSKVIVYNYRDDSGHFILNTIMSYFKSMEESVANQAHDWYEMDKPYVPITIGALVSAVGAATFTFTTVEEDLTAQVGDVLVSGANGPTNHYVTAVAANAAVWDITVRKLDGSNYAAGDLTVGDALGNSLRVFGEGTGQPDGQRWTPDNYSNYLTITKATHTFTGNAGATKAEVDIPVAGVDAWVYENQLQSVIEFIRKRSNALMMATEVDGTDGNGMLVSRGIITDILANGTVQQTYNTTITEAELRAMIEAQNALNSQKEFVLLCGLTQYADLQDILQDTYLTDGAVNFGTFRTDPEFAVGLGISSYSYLGRIVHLVHCRYFDSPGDVGAVLGGATATDIDFSNFGVLLAIGKSGGKAWTTSASTTFGQKTIPMLSYMYNASKTHNRKFVTGHYIGMTGSIKNSMGRGSSDDGNGYSATQDIPMTANVVSSDVDRDQFFMLSEVGPRLAGVQVCHGSARDIGA